jgi:hypothetical protein
MASKNQIKRLQLNKPTKYRVMKLKTIMKKGLKTKNSNKKNIENKKNNLKKAIKKKIQMNPG